MADMAGAKGRVAGLAPPCTEPADAAGSDVAGRLALVVSAAAAGGLSGVDSEQALAVVEAVEVVKAWADAVALDATAVMVAEFESDFADIAPGPSHLTPPSTRLRRVFVRSCRSAAAREIQVATGLPITACQRRVWLSACEPERVGPVREAMRAGRVTLVRAIALTEATQDLDAFTAARIAARVLRPLSGPDGVPLPGMAPLSQATFLARLHKQLVLAHGMVGEAERTYAQGVKSRYLKAEPNRDGTGSLLITGAGPRVAAACGRVDKIARRLRKGGDARTIAQLRADVATDLLLRGWIPNDPTFTKLGAPPTAMVDVIASLPTLLGVEHGAAMIPGWGAISAAQARKLALAQGSIWRRVVTDPLTGRAIEASAGTYAVPAGMALQVKTRDGTCRAPGCEIPTEHTDLDHTLEWLQDRSSSGGAGGPTAENVDRPTAEGAGGPTAETNLVALHRGHHNLKTSGFWDSDQQLDGTVVWTTATGRKVNTYPYLYDHPDNLPIAASPLETCHGRRLAKVLNPDIPLPGHFSIFDHLAWSEALLDASPPPEFTYASSHHHDEQHATTATSTADSAAVEDYPPPPF